MNRIRALQWPISVSTIFAIIALWSCSDSPGPSDPILPGSQSGEDVTPPQQINDARLSWDGHLILHWSAPWDDTVTEPVSGYEIRFSTAFFDSNSFWEHATPVTVSACPGMLGQNPPECDPGDLQQFAFPEVGRKRIHVAVRGRDEDGNLSPLSNIASFSPPGYTFVGSCMDLLNSNQEVPNLAVHAVIELPPFPPTEQSLSTSINGTFTINDIPEGATLTIEVSDGQSGIDYHEMQKEFTISAETAYEFVMIEYNDTFSDPDMVNAFGSILNLLFQAYADASEYGLPIYTLKRWPSIPIQIYLPNDFSPPFPGLTEIVQNGIALWNTRWQDEFGMNLFEIISSNEVPSSGIYIRSYTDNPGSPVRGVTIKEAGEQGEHATLYKIWFNTHKIGFVTDLDVAHELGHTMPWGHPYDIVPQFVDHLMYGNSGPFSDEEAEAAFLMFRLPYNFDFAPYGFTKDSLGGH